MKFRFDNRYLHWGVTAFLVAAASMLFYFGIFQMDSLLKGIRTILGILTPVIYGAAMAYLLSPVVNFCENKLVYPLCKKQGWKPSAKIQKLIRYLCVFFSLFLFLALIYILIMMILPQLIRSIMNIIYDFPFYIRDVQKWINDSMENNPDLNASMTGFLTEYSAKIENYLTTNILPQLQNTLWQISAGVFDIINFLKNFLIGIIVSIYVMADKEMFVAKSKMLIYAFLPAGRANRIIRDMRFTNKTFGGFISGKILDSAIIGVLCYVGTSLIGTPYAVLVSVIVGVTNVIPFFGPYIGAVPCALLVLLVDPLQCLYFVIFIFALQQFDGNILGPKILGDSTGLSSFMVIVAILVGGGLFGIVGMFVGVPVCAVIYAMIWRWMQKALNKKKMPMDVEEYYEMDCLDPNTLEPLDLEEEKRASSFFRSVRPKLADEESISEQTEKNKNKKKEDKKK